MVVEHCTCLLILMKRLLCLKHTGLSRPFVIMGDWLLGTILLMCGMQLVGSGGFAMIGQCSLLTFGRWIIIIVTFSSINVSKNKIFFFSITR